MASVRDDKMHGTSKSMARNIVEVKRKLATSKRYSIGPELDRHIDTIIENSKAVAHVSRGEYREAILRECGEVSPDITIKTRRRSMHTEFKVRVTITRQRTRLCHAGTGFSGFDAA